MPWQERMRQAHRWRNVRWRRRHQAQGVDGCIALGLPRQVIQVMVFHRAFMRCLHTIGMDDGMELLWMRLRKTTRRLDGVETGPEQNSGEK
jgi:hypothetical protein